MNIKTLFNATILLIVLLTAGFQCSKEDIELNPKYEFFEKLSLSPYKKIYSINDTITIQFQTNDKKLFDKLSNSLISTDTSQLHVGFYYHKRYIIENQPEFFCEIKVDNPIDLSFTTLYSWYNVLSFKTDCSAPNYFLKASFIPKKTGIFSLEPFISNQYCQNKIDRPYTTTKFIFDLADCNKDIWLSIPPASRGGELGFTDVQIDEKEIFVFKVE
ncbi:MAG: hypothetical protein ACXITV_08550 [Luteibaculaceae bacterium]